MSSSDGTISAKSTIDFNRKSVTIALPQCQVVMVQYQQRVPWVLIEKFK